MFLTGKLAGVFQHENAATQITSAAEAFLAFREGYSSGKALCLRRQSSRGREEATKEAIK